MESRLLRRQTTPTVAAGPSRLPRRPAKGKATRRGSRLRFAPFPRASLTADRSALDITKMAPLGDRVLVKPLEAEDKTEGGILLPSSAADTGREARFGEVLSVGEDVQLSLSKGDKIVFNMFSSAKVEVPDGEIVFVHDKNVLATLS